MKKIVQKLNFILNNINWIMMTILNFIECIYFNA